MTSLFLLSVRQLAGGKRIWVMVVFSAIPVLLGFAFRFASPQTSAAQFDDGVTNLLIVSAILPLVMLFLGTATLGNEYDDRTLPFLVLKPISRWTIVASKLLATLAAGGVPVALSGSVSTLLITGDAGQAATTAVALLFGAAAYAAMFTWAGLAVRYALPLGAAYLLVWEAALSTFLGGTRFLSVRQYTLAIIKGLDADRLRDSVVELGLIEGLVGAAVVAAVFVTLTTRRLERMDIP